MRKKIAVTFIISMALLVLAGISYAYFSLLDTNIPQTLSLNAGTLSLVFRDNDNGINASLSFGSSITKKFTIENDGTREAYATMSFKDLENTYLKGSLKYSLEYSEEENGTYTKILENRDVPRSINSVNRVIAADLYVPAGTTYYYNLIVTLIDSDTVDQTSDLTATFETNFMIEEGSARIKPVVINERGEEIENGIALLDTLGTKVALGSENFYVIGNDNGKVKLLAEHTLADGSDLSYFYNPDLPYYIVYFYNSDNIYSEMYPYEKVQEITSNLGVTFTYVGKATWDSATSKCKYNDEVIYLLSGYSKEIPIQLPADYKSCNDVYAITIDNISTYATGITEEKYKRGFQTKADYQSIYTTSFLSESSHETYYNRAFDQEQDIYEYNYVKDLTDEYANTITKTTGIYTEGTIFTKDNYVDIISSLENEEDNALVKNINVSSYFWLCTAKSENRIYVTGWRGSIRDYYYYELEAVGVKPVIVISEDEFD